MARCTSITNYRPSRNNNIHLRTIVSFPISHIIDLHILAFNTSLIVRQHFLNVNVLVIAVSLVFGICSASSYFKSSLLNNAIFVYSSNTPMTNWSHIAVPRSLKVQCIASSFNLAINSVTDSFGRCLAF